ncbi:DUF6284 family protein [Pilimelia columellifera]|uniref:Uncharacterized protein n=1 Tax=Pilimelia columellifera subsp. columellifera TaxID=706583 RepID=A0ABN3NB01_9ACTN
MKRVNRTSHTPPIPVVVLVDETQQYLNDPTPADLQAIEDEWPLIVAELAVVDAECVMAHREHPTELDRRRLRRATDQVLRVAVDQASRTNVVVSLSQTRAA